MLAGGITAPSWLDAIVYAKVTFLWTFKWNISLSNISFRPLWGERAQDDDHVEDRTSHVRAIWWMIPYKYRNEASGKCPILLCRLYMKVVWWWSKGYIFLGSNISDSCCRSSHCSRTVFKNYYYLFGPRFWIYYPVRSNNTIRMRHPTTL